MPATLAAELWDMVVDHLHSDRDSLRACGLTCKSWLPASRYHLLRLLILVPYNFHKFIGILSPSSLTTIGPYVHRLTLVEGKQRSAAEPKWVAKALPTLSAHLAKVESLQILWLYWSDEDSLACSALLDSFSALKVLSLSNLTFDNRARLLEVIASFPRLESLRIAKVMFLDPDNSEVVIPNVRPPISLTEIRVHNSFIAIVLDWLATSPVVGALRTISLHSLPARETVSAARLLHALGPQLEHLSLSICYDYPVEPKSAIETHFHHVRNPNLRTFHVNNIFIVGGDDADFEWVPALLLHIKSPLLQSVRFTFRAMGPECFQIFPWASVEQILLRMDLPTLNVSIQFWGDSKLKAAGAEYARKHLPRLQAKGGLVFT